MFVSVTANCPARKLLALITSFYMSLAVSANSSLDVYLTDLVFDYSCLLPKS